MADNNKEIDDILNEVKARKEQLNKDENPFSDIKENEVKDEEVTINIADKASPEESDEQVNVETDKAVNNSPVEELPQETEAQEELKEDASVADKAETEETSEPETSQEENNFKIIDDGEDKDLKYEEQLDEKEAAEKKKKIIIISAVILVVIILIAGIVFAVTHKDAEEPETTTAIPTTETTTKAPVLIVNPLTGENDYNTEAVGKRPVACVVENSQPSRPQWGIDDETTPPDIILQGEVEGGETRMLWFFADYTNLPENIGPTRSARPPYVRFSELFDSIFIHWGMSSTTDDYYGADSVFVDDDVDHINQMTFSDSVGLFGRYNPRGVSLEHTGVIYGENVPAAIESMDFRTDVDNEHFSKLSFNTEIEKLSDISCTYLSLKYSSRSGSTEWSYGEDGQYHTSDFNNDVKRENLLVLMDETQYITKSNYKGQGSNEIYCDYKFAGGNGKLASNGTVIDITWSVEDGLLVIKDSAGKAVNLNPGKTWIGWGSSNNGGSVEVQ